MDTKNFTNVTNGLNDPGSTSWGSEVRVLYRPLVKAVTCRLLLCKSLSVAPLTSMSRDKISARLKYSLAFFFVQRPAQKSGLTLSPHLVLLFLVKEEGMSEDIMDREFPFIIYGMSNEEYQSRNDFMRRTMLCQVSRYGGEALKFMDEGHSLFKGSSATTLGSKFDHLVERLIQGIPVSDTLKAPDSTVLSKSGQRRGKAWDEFKKEVEEAGQIACSADDEFQLTTMADHLMDHPVARQLVEDTEQTQASCFFIFEGVHCAVRPDGMVPKDHPEPRWWDLKSTSSTWDKLHRSVFDYGYAEQEFFYVDCAKQLGWPSHRMPFVFVQTMPPFACRVYYLPEEIVRDAGARLINTINEIQLRRRTGVYLPVEAEQILELEVPAWARKEEEVFCG